MMILRYFGRGRFVIQTAKRPRTLESPFLAL